jgi:folylpolyglutamate synthase/dihydropteroate synthase
MRELAELLAEVLDAGEDLGPSFFEVTIAATFLAFSRAPPMPAWSKSAWAGGSMRPMCWSPRRWPPAGSPRWASITNASCSGLEDAINWIAARLRPGEEGTILITGSLYLAGQVLKANDEIPD